jgi:hypothetical protein
VPVAAVQYKEEKSPQLRRLLSRFYFESSGHLHSCQFARVRPLWLWQSLSVCRRCRSKPIYDRGWQCILRKVKWRQSLHCAPNRTNGVHFIWLLCVKFELLEILRRPLALPPLLRRE